MKPGDRVVVVDDDHAVARLGATGVVVESMGDGERWRVRMDVLFASKFKLDASDPRLLGIRRERLRVLA